MLRTIISLLYLVFFFLISLFLLPFEWVVGKFDKQKELRQSCAIIKWGFSCLISLAGAKVKIVGEENIPKDNSLGLVFMGNHRSYYDIIITYRYLPFFTTVYSKAAMEKFPIVGIWMKRINVLFLDNKDMKQQLKMILKGIDMIKEGDNIVIFPEGKRNKEAGVDEFKAGSFKLATKTGASIVPFVITNTRELWERQFPSLKSQKIVLEFLPPVETAKLSKEEIKKLPDKVWKLVSDKYESLTSN